MDDHINKKVINRFYKDNSSLQDMEVSYIFSLFLPETSVGETSEETFGRIVQHGSLRQNSLWQMFLNLIKWIISV